MIVEKKRFVGSHSATIGKRGNNIGIAVNVNHDVNLANGAPASKAVKRAFGQHVEGRPGAIGHRKLDPGLHTKGREGGIPLEEVLPRGRDPGRSIPGLYVAGFKTKQYIRRWKTQDVTAREKKEEVIQETV